MYCVAYWNNANPTRNADGRFYNGYVSICCQSLWNMEISRDNETSTATSSKHKTFTLFKKLAIEPKGTHTACRDADTKTKKRH